MTQPETVQVRRLAVNPERFWARVDKTADCWLWTSYRDKDGYGMFGEHSTRAHRIAFALEHGHEAVLYVLHTCDNRACVRPTHLYEGTQAQNIRDAVERGRTTAGERNPRYKHGRFVGEFARLKARRTNDGD